ncbi:MAG TPA: isochorismatase family cysteine hydrolase [Terriglobales bacterium]|nr:isochorismatase family cysteine hydrolase [Terriglobales bacterium]
MKCAPGPGGNDLHGSAPDESPLALVLIDVINDLDFKGNQAIVKVASRMARSIAALKRRVKAAGVPVIYVNDNFGLWQSDFRKLIEHCLNDGEEVARILRPEDDDYFVLKPKHSGFYSTTRDTLLRYLGASSVILTGIAANICVLFTANDAYMRDLKLFVPEDCTVSNSEEENRFAMEQMRRILKADIRPSVKINFGELLKDAA